MTSRMPGPSLLVLSLCIALFTVRADAAQVDFLGSRTVADRTESDTIQVPGDARYGALRLCVENRSVHFKDLDVFFGNGGHQDATVSALVGPGECTRWIDLKGDGPRNIARIVMRYEMLINAGQQAVVKAYGRR